MRSWTKMLKELTLRPHTRQIRKVPPLPVDSELPKPLSPKVMHSLLGESTDVIFREFSLRGQEEIPCTLVAVDGLIDKLLLDGFILRVLMVDFAGEKELEQMTVENALKTVFKFLAPAIEIKIIKKTGDAVDAVLSGDAVLFLGDTGEALIIGARGWANRGVAEPETESVVRGPREGFSETLRTSTSLLRRKIKHPSLRMKSLKIGDLTKTDIVVTYIEGVAKPDIVQEVMRRLGRIKIDGILESAYIEEMIEDVPYSPFPQVRHTERPDVLAAALLEGKIGIMVDGTPMVLMVPAVLTQFLQVSEDYYEKAVIVILVRFIRYLGAAIALLAPSIYIAVATYHQEIIPTTLALSIAAGRSGVPVTALLEAILMTLALEIVQEAGLRLPKPIGQTIGIVGAIVIGDAAVKASLVSPQMVIIVALTAIATYSIAYYDLAIALRLIRFPLMLLAGSLGFFGIGLGLYGLLIHLLSMRSFGHPYLSPMAPLRLRTLLQDTFVRAPWWALKRRPQIADVDEPRGGGR